MEIQMGKATKSYTYGANWLSYTKIISITSGTRIKNENMKNVRFIPLFATFLNISPKTILNNGLHSLRSHKTLGADRLVRLTMKK
jgi:hypothetical protein